MKKHLFSAATLAIALFAINTASAQTVKTEDGGDKTKTTVDGMTVKTKVADDGKMKVKGKDEAGNRMKATTKPRKGDMKDGMDMQAGDMKMHHKGMKGMHHKDKGMRKDSAAMRSSTSSM
jgi:hypothetical protein